MNDKRYAQHIADLRNVHRPQRVWGEGKGILMVVGHFLVGVAGGTWLVGSVFDVTPSLVVALVLGALGAIAHLAFLGRPERAFKMMRHVRTSWISRGFVGLSLFLIGGTAYVVLQLVSPVAVVWSVLTTVAQAIAWVGTLTIIGYMGFCYTASKAIPFWHSPLHPAIYIAFALRGGIAVLMVIDALNGVATGDSLLHLWIGVTAVVVLFVALEIQGAWSSRNVAARWSVRDMLAGRLALSFYIGALLIGLVVPALLLGVYDSYTPTVLALVGLASMAGDFFVKLSTVRAGVYLPLVSPARRQRA
ncbi:MAG: polysulfide reductase NrfD [Burkholderiaceae bacterium]|nr:polysulfide reductase NrfD [Burkholderiaceae bacterium]